MEFTYDSYGRLTELVKRKGYSIADYHQVVPKCVILRHDVDLDLKKAAEFARFERERQVHSTYFVLLCTDMYNVFSHHSQKYLEEILACGHEVGLHFDETRYRWEKPEEVTELILDEKKIMEKAVGVPVTTVSMHRPSRKILDADIEIPGMVNSYSDFFFREFKYVSDSRFHWREDVEEIVANEEADKIHILTHPFGYRMLEQRPADMLREAVRQAGKEKYDALKENIRDIEEFLGMDIYDEGGANK